MLALLDDTVAEITDDGRTSRLRLGAIPTSPPITLQHKREPASIADADDFAAVAGGKSENNLIGSVIV